MSNIVFIVNGDIGSVVNKLNEQGFNNLYIDGGITTQNFLKQDLIDEMIITTIPILLGDGIPLFGNLLEPLMFKNISSQRFLDAIVQNHFVRVRD